MIRRKPTGDQVRALLSLAGWSDEQAATVLGVRARTIRAALNDHPSLPWPLWQLLRVYALQSARDALPAAPVQDWSGALSRVLDNAAAVEDLRSDLQRAERESERTRAARPAEFSP